jgi:hypothetical protein
VAWRDPSEQISLIRKANNMKKLLPLSKHEQRCMQRIQARLLQSMELGELKGLGFDMAMMGFSIGELNSLVPAAAGLTEDDAVPAPPDTRLPFWAIFGCSGPTTGYYAATRPPSTP